LCHPEPPKKTKYAEKLQNGGEGTAQKMGKLLISHRSTIYPCFIPDLGEFTGAGRIRLTRHKSIKKQDSP
jgi:hypothetical protein